MNHSDKIFAFISIKHVSFFYPAFMFSRSPPHPTLGWFKINFGSNLYSILPGGPPSVSVCALATVLNFNFLRWGYFFFIVIKCWCSDAFGEMWVKASQRCRDAFCKILITKWKDTRVYHIWINASRLRWGSEKNGRNKNILKNVHLYFMLVGIWLGWVLMHCKDWKTLAVSLHKQLFSSVNIQLSEVGEPQVVGKIRDSC